MRYLLTLLFMAALSVGAATLTAEEPASTAPQPETPEQPEAGKVESPKVPIFKDGDKIYLSVTGNVPRMVIYQSSVGKNEFNNKGFSKEDGYPDNLVPYDKGIDVRVWSREGTNTEVMRINAKELLDGLQKQIKANPNDKTKWKTVRENKNGKATFAFAGIQRFYELRSIKIPAGSNHRKHSQYSGGHAPGLRLRIDKDGKYVGYIQTKNKAWETDFPAGAGNRIEVREGLDERFLLRLRDWNVGSFGSEHPITEFSDITSEDFEKGHILEKIDIFERRESATTLIFRSIK